MSPLGLHLKAAAVGHELDSASVHCREQPGQRDVLKQRIQRLGVRVSEPVALPRRYYGGYWANSA